MGKKVYFLILVILAAHNSYNQDLHIKGVISDGIVPLSGVTIRDKATDVLLGVSRFNGTFYIKSKPVDSASTLVIEFSRPGFQNQEVAIKPAKEDTIRLQIVLSYTGNALDEVVVTGSLRPTDRKASTVPVSVINASVFERISSPRLMDALPLLPGIRLHYDCNVCEAPGLRFNGLPGPYTLLVIDGMPIMGPLAATYGLYGFPSAMIQRMEVTRGPGSVLFGTEAMGGVINVLTTNPDVAPPLRVEQLLTSWGEVTTQLSSAYRVGQWRMLTGVYHHHFGSRIDRNAENFLDMALQERISVFQKIRFSDELDILLRYYYEDRLGGTVAGQHYHRHTHDEYVESIFTNRAEWLMKYNPRKLKPLQVWWSASGHWQNSMYGEDYFLAEQRIMNFQTLWQEHSGNLQYTLGTALRYQFYNDNTTATTLYSGSDTELDAPESFHMPALFADAMFPLKNVSFSAGIRADYHSIHGFVPTGRIGVLYSAGRHTLRATHGSAFRVINLFAEEHAALSGAREVVISSRLRPERVAGQYAEWEFSLLKPHYYIKSILGAFANEFSNRILPDYDSDPQKIIFDNLDGRLTHRGINAQVEFGIGGRWDFSMGGALQDMRLIEDDKRELPPFVERMNFQSLMGYTFGKNRIDISSFTYSPMRLPLAGELDPRPEFSPWFTHLHLQYSYRSERGYSLTFGIKNLLDFVPWRGLPFLIARADDPFDTRVEFNSEGVPIPTADNPYALTFDPAYAFTSLQGRRFFFQWSITF
ncbi:hypothetical protein JCM31826_16750 [Thermaurantimonas aggregans]|uniref:TonB-dependent receptor plug domain-containing protein n=1 Tax=Thermaurantimonas aggregans TaxID=2173829 RepID=A0A401XMG5_9FLAO|nr:TonB-dependent receptor plug domain-containing protein [Thermaurantimonas aggregans]MCX8148390.1 TonB-dependent receptor [Thermaurantimonas aggregans]GCD78193.1 hypothetical protein JCM31826_16750 [Thermaurantimonas aggregans]